jgi:hypothetical protein
MISSPTNLRANKNAFLTMDETEASGELTMHSATLPLDPIKC